MLGLLVFQNIYFNLGEECRNRLLGNIFDIINVSISDVAIRNNRIIFKLFSNGIFYQYVFILGVGENKVLFSDKIVDSVVFIYNEDVKQVNKFIYLLVQCLNEYQVYQLLKQFL